MDTLQLALHTECFRAKAVYGTMNYLVVRHNSRGSEVYFLCLLTGVEALIRLVKETKLHTVAGLDTSFVVQSFIFII